MANQCRDLATSGPSSSDAAAREGGRHTGSGRGCSPDGSTTATRLTTSCAGHWFAALAERARHPDVTLHRLRHTVATVLVGQGDILQAQHRLGHRDAATTLRIYSQAMPLTDAEAARTLDSLFR